MIERTMLKSIAAQKPLTSNPLITADAKSTMMAFITKVKSPKVKILIGRVMMRRIGLTSTLMTPRKRATHNAEKNPSTTTPGIRWAAMPIEMVIINHLRIKNIEVHALYYS
jgi:hypothetical protein